MGNDFFRQPDAKHHENHDGANAHGVHSNDDDHTHDSESTHEEHNHLEQENLPEERETAMTKKSAPILSAIAFSLLFAFSFAAGTQAEAAEFSFAGVEARFDAEFEGDFETASFTTAKSAVFDFKSSSYEASKFGATNFQFTASKAPNVQIFDFRAAKFENPQVKAAGFNAFTSRTFAVAKVFDGKIFSFESIEFRA